jgi:hypothetical protein
MRLSKFIRANPDDIERAWEDFARNLTGFAAELNDSALRDDLRAILTAMADDMDTAQSSMEQQAKSKGQGPRGGALDLITAAHANARMGSVVFINSVSLRAAVALPRQNVRCSGKVLVGCPSQMPHHVSPKARW